jgi:hypothetical protein
MRERGLRSIEDVIIEEVTVEITTLDPASYNSDLSPNRIVFIILGTIGFFCTGLLLLKNVAWMFRERSSIHRKMQHRCCSLCCLCRRECQDCCEDLQHYLCPYRGFNALTGGEGEGEGEDGDHTDFQASIHYRGQHRTYLDDDHDEDGNNKSSHGGGSLSPPSPVPLSSSMNKRKQENGYQKLQLNVSDSKHHSLREVYNAFTIEDDDDDDEVDEDEDGEERDDSDVVSIELTSHVLHSRPS